MSRPEIAIISHCWQYDRLLTYQLSSLALWPPKDVLVTVYVCMTVEDKPTIDTVTWFWLHAQTEAFQVRGVYLDRERLMRRGIGRNVACRCLENPSFVWFADCDMIFGPDCLDSLPGLFNHDELICYPHFVDKCPHEDGDELIGDVTGPGVYPIALKDFTIHDSQPRAIGGIQIVTGETAKRGYLPEGSKWHRPEKEWKKTAEDVAYRKWLNGDVKYRGAKIELPDVFRIRHTECGRDQTGVRN